MSNQRTLTLVISSVNEPISFNPLASDDLTNQTYMNALVGTLVKTNGQGRYEPYLATKWHTDDNKTWTFELRDHLKSEDGELITAQEFKRSLETVIRIYHANRPNLPIIEEIEGFNNFVSGKSSSLSGLKSDGHTLSFTFSKPLVSGVLEYLAMPYYGYYSSKNFAAEKWKDDLNIIASGSHKVSSIDPVGRILTLQSRKRWFSLADGAPEFVRITQDELNDAFRVAGPKIIGTSGMASAEQLDRFHLVQVSSVPEVLVAFKLNDKSGFFANKGNRQVFLRKLRTAQERIKLDGEGLTFSKYFYPFFETPIQEEPSTNHTFHPTSATISIVLPPSSSSKRLSYLSAIANEALAGSGAHVDTKKSVPVGEAKKLNPDVLGIVVTIGGGFEHWLTKMMFCSDLGIGFGDPGHRIQKLVDRFDGANWKIDEFAREFNNILYDEASTIPIYHNSYKWLLDGVNPGPSLISFTPRLDLVEI